MFFLKTPYINIFIIEFSTILDRCVHLASDTYGAEGKQDDSGNLIWSDDVTIVNDDDVISMMMC